MDLGIQSLVNVHKTALISLTGDDLVKLALEIRVEYQAHNDGIRFGKLQAKQLKAKRKVISRSQVRRNGR